MAIPPDIAHALRLRGQLAQSPWKWALILLTAPLLLALSFTAWFVFFRIPGQRWVTAPSFGATFIVAVALNAIIQMWWMRRRLKSTLAELDAAKGTLCLECRYDVSPELTTCPECGRAVDHEYARGAWRIARQGFIKTMREIEERNAKPE